MIFLHFDIVHIVSFSVGETNDKPIAELVSGQCQYLDGLQSKIRKTVIRTYPHICIKKNSFKFKAAVLHFRRAKIERTLHAKITFVRAKHYSPS